VNITHAAALAGLFGLDYSHRWSGEIVKSEMFDNFHPGNPSGKINQSGFETASGYNSPFKKYHI